jgi:hypothetical protein
MTTNIQTATSSEKATSISKSVRPTILLFPREFPGTQNRTYQLDKRKKSAVTIYQISLSSICSGEYLGNKQKMKQILTKNMLLIDSISD